MIYLISAEKLKEESLIHGNVEDLKLKPIIKDAQNIHIDSALGTPLYARILDGVDNDNLTANEITLLKEYIQPYLRKMVEINSVPHINFEIRNKSFGAASDQYNTAADWKSVEQMIEKLEKDAAYYHKKLVGYLMDNRTLFTEYDDWCAGNKVEVEPDDMSDSYSNSIGFIFNSK